MPYDFWRADAIKEVLRSASSGTLGYYLAVSSVSSYAISLLVTGGKFRTTAGTYSIYGIK